MIRADDFYCSIALSGEARIDFLAPLGAQEMQIFVRSSVCPMKSVLELKIFIFLSQDSLRSP